MPCLKEHKYNIAQWSLNTHAHFHFPPTNLNKFQHSPLISTYNTYLWLWLWLLQRINQFPCVLCRSRCLLQSCRCGNLDKTHVYPTVWARGGHYAHQRENLNINIFFVILTHLDTTFWAWTSVTTFCPSIFVRSALSCVAIIRELTNSSPILVQ